MKHTISTAFAALLATSVAATSLPTNKIAALAEKQVNNKTIFGVALTVAHGDSIFNCAYGNLIDSGCYFGASTTKLYTTAVVFMMDEAGMIKLDDPAYKHLPPGTMDGLHVFRGIDRSREITIRQLLAHTSGLPDYFTQKDANGNTLFGILRKHIDTAWSFERTLAIARTMKPRFAPGTRNKAFYSDLNFQLLGRIIELKYGKEIDEVFQELIYSKLGLVNTYIYTDPADTRPAEMFYRSKPLHVPRAMASFRADGGIVTTNREAMIFTRAFFSGTLFSKKYLDLSQEWRRIFPPLRYGTGIMMFRLPALSTGFKKLPYLVGHSGHSGAFCWYCPETDTYYTGTVNQVGKPSLSYKLMVKMILLK